jgi:hypothetical protein
MIESKKIKAKHIVLEPGDTTRYEFIITEDINCFEKKEYLFITLGGCNSPNFKGYLFRKDSIRWFIEKNGKPPGKKEYQKWINKIFKNNNSFEKDYVKYIQAHTGNSNFYTALASIIAGWYYLTEKNI